MMMQSRSNRMMSCHMSAYQAEASSCAYTANHCAANNIVLILDAIFMASIIICALHSLLSVLVLGISLVLVLLVVLLIPFSHTPMMRKRA